MSDNKPIAKQSVTKPASQPGPSPPKASNPAAKSKPATQPTAPQSKPAGAVAQGQAKVIFKESDNRPKGGQTVRPRKASTAPTEGKIKLSPQQGAGPKTAPQQGPGPKSATQQGSGPKSAPGPGLVKADNVGPGNKPKSSGPQVKGQVKPSIVEPKASNPPIKPRVTDSDLVRNDTARQMFSVLGATPSPAGSVHNPLNINRLSIDSAVFQRPVQVRPMSAPPKMIGASAGKPAREKFDPSRRPVKFESQVVIDYVQPTAEKPVVMHMYELRQFKLSMSIKDRNLHPGAMVVQLWTDAKEMTSNEGEYHAAPLTYTPTLSRTTSQTPGGGGEEGDMTAPLTCTFATNIIFDCLGAFSFTYRFKTDAAGNDNWSWLQGPMGSIKITPARDPEFWAPAFTGPDYTQMLGPIHVGNEVAARQPGAEGFTHIINVAEELTEPSGLAGQKTSGQQIGYDKIGLREGVQHGLSEDKIQRAIDILTKNWTPVSKVLLYSSRGFGRAQSLLLAFVLAKNPHIDFEEARKDINYKRLFLVHAELQQTVERLYPRQSTSTHHLL